MLTKKAREKFMAAIAPMRTEKSIKAPHLSISWLRRVTWWELTSLEYLQWSIIVKLVACIMDLPYIINFRLTSLFLAVFTWEICSFIFVPFNRSFNRYPPKEKFDNDKIFLTSTLAMKHLTGLCKLFRFFLLRRPWQAISLVQLNLAKKEFQCKHG